jgi:hypothetical protein
MIYLACCCTRSHAKHNLANRPNPVRASRQSVSGICGLRTVSSPAALVPAVRLIAPGQGVMCADHEPRVVDDFCTVPSLTESDQCYEYTAYHCNKNSRLRPLHVQVLDVMFVTSAARDTDVVLVHHLLAGLANCVLSRVLY